MHVDVYFTPEDITALVVAFEDTLRDLRLVDRTDPVVTLVAKRIIEVACQCERNPKVLRDAVAKSFSEPR